MWELNDWKTDNYYTKLRKVLYHIKYWSLNKIYSWANVLYYKYYSFNFIFYYLSLIGYKLLGFLEDIKLFNNTWNFTTLSMVVFNLSSQCHSQIIWIVRRYVNDVEKMVKSIRLVLKERLHRSFFEKIWKKLWKLI